MMLSLAARTRIAALATTAVAALAAAGPAHAACSSSTPSTTSFADSPTDGDSGLAPEIHTVAAAVDGACHVTVDPGVTYPLITGDSVFVYVDTDGNPATGDPVFQGADRAIGTLGGYPPLMGAWNPATATMSFADGQQLTPYANGGFEATLDQLGIAASPTTTALRAASMWEGPLDDYFDFAPDAGAAPFPLPVAFTAAAPAPPVVVLPPVTYTPPATAAPTTPAQTVNATSTPTPRKAKKPACTVPSVKRLTTAAARAALRHAGCTAGDTTKAYSSKVAAGHVIATDPHAGARTSAAVDLVVSRGRRHARAHRAAAGAGSPAAVANALAAAATRLDDAGAAG
jgi:hypothetical protein